MAGIANGVSIKVRWDGHALVPAHPLDLQPGEEIEVMVKAGHEDASSMAERFRGVIGVIHAPPEFNWDWDRDDLYRDGS